MIPKELQERKQWICWRYEQAPGRAKPTKIPYNPLTGYRASSTDASTWTDFETAKANASRYSGIGFVFTKEDPYVGIDLDHVLDSKGEFIQKDAREIFEKCASYTEISPSGTGIHILGKAKLHDMAHKVEENPELGTCEKELYESGRYFTVTGHQLGNVSEIKDVQSMTDELEQIMAEAQKGKKKAAKSVSKASAKENMAAAPVMQGNEEDPVITYARTVFPEINTAQKGQGERLHDKAVHIAQFLQEGEIQKAVKDQDLFITYKQKGMVRTTVIPDQGLGFNIPNNPTEQKAYLYSKLFRHLDRTQTWDITKRPQFEKMHKVTQMIIANMEKFPGGGGTRKYFNMEEMGKQLGRPATELMHEIMADTAQIPALSRTLAKCQTNGMTGLLVSKEIIGAFSHGNELQIDKVEEIKSNEQTVKMENLRSLVSNTMVATEQQASFLWLQKQGITCQVIPEEKLSKQNYRNCSFPNLHLEKPLEDAIFDSCHFDHVELGDKASLKNVVLDKCRFSDEKDMTALVGKGAEVKNCMVYRLDPELGKKNWQLVGTEKPKFIENAKTMPESKTPGGMER